MVSVVRGASENGFSDSLEERHGGARGEYASTPSSRTAEASIPRLSTVGGFGLFLVVGGFFVVLHFATGTESLLAPGFDLSWRLVDSGHVERHGLTRKTSKFRIYERPRVILLPGETLEVDYAFEGDRGGAAVSVMHHGWIRVLTDRETVASSGRFTSGAPGRLRAEAVESGVYELGVYLREAVGTVSVDWRVVNPRPAGRLLRALQFGGFVLFALVLVLVAYALIRTALGGD